MKLDNKGFTVIELILSFVFVMFLAVAMFSLVSNYRNRELKESVKRDLLALENTLTQDIYEDTLKRKVDNISYCKDDDGKNLKQCINIFFLDGTKKTLEVKEEIVTTEDDGTPFKYETFNILYGGVKYKNPDPKFAKVVNDFILSYTTDDDGLEYGTIYKIMIRIKHQDIEHEYVVNVVTTGVN